MKTPNLHHLPAILTLAVTMVAFVAVSSSTQSIPDIFESDQNNDFNSLPAKLHHKKEIAGNTCPFRTYSNLIIIVATQFVHAEPLLCKHFSAFAHLSKHR